MARRLQVYCLLEVRELSKPGAYNYNGGLGYD